MPFKTPTTRQMRAARSCVRADDRVRLAEQARDAAYDKARQMGMHWDVNHPEWPRAFEVADGGMYIVDGED